MRQKVIAGAAVAVALGGGAFAAVSATGQGDGNRRVHARHGAHRLQPHDLIAAAAYLGISTGRLESELSSSGSLAQVAQAHGGKSAQGLIDAIVAARKTRLAKVAAGLPGRVAAEVNAPARLGGGSAEPRAGALGAFAARRSLAATVAGYLGIAPSDLRRDLRSGKTLAQIADTTPGKSSTGLVDALVAARKERLAHGLAAGKLSKARVARSQSRLDKRMNALVTRKFARAGKP